ncbi:MAG: NAD(P)/FAD-dependent oxidoreductase [Pseudomonadota bacterium]
MDYDVIIVGGSWAGLAAAMQLARARRKICVIDSGMPRNRFADASHGVFGFDGMAPAEINRTVRAQLLAYPSAAIRDGAAVDARPDGDGFSVGLADGLTLAANRLILATGVVDELPLIPGLQERWGKSVLHCPYCDGYEVADRRLGVLATMDESLHQAAVLVDWSANIVVFTNGAVSPDTATLGDFRAKGLQIEDVPVSELVGDVPALRAARLEDGREIPLDALFTISRTRMATPLADQLGCAFEEGPFGPVISTDEQKQTTVAGVYAAGDAARPVHNASWALADGVTAGIAAHQSLLT